MVTCVVTCVVACVVTCSYMLSMCEKKTEG